MRCFIQDLILIVHYYLHLFLHGSSSLFGNHWCISRVTRSYWVKNLDLSFGVQKHAWIWMVQSDLLKWTGRTLKRIKSLLKKIIMAQKMKFSIKDFFFSIRVFFHGHWHLTGQQGKGGDHLIPLCHFHPLKNIQTFICNFAREMTTFIKLCSGVWSTSKKIILVSLKYFLTRLCR